jgi:hypothetical protein
VEQLGGRRGEANLQPEPPQGAGLRTILVASSIVGAEVLVDGRRWTRRWLSGRQSCRRGPCEGYLPESKTVPSSRVRPQLAFEPKDFRPLPRRGHAAGARDHKDVEVSV